MILLLIVATLFTMIGAAMVLLDYNYYNGLQYLVTAVAFFTTAYIIKVGKLDIEIATDSKRTQFIAGLMITVVALNITFVALSIKGLFWAVGIAVFIISIYNIYKK
ncbi:hypothetical protein [Methanococcoides seepicolus]|uniref:Uncharacterized protein n=1 Tax=Methanococcoides seepicolus TaxID=2828780 RepID=A0A9E4ZFN3_9EURY|nr:hypothetical protein [Methanococcoides seepicolus]MCM1986765.1 hypothetical protein [Methanococcoides seepicolus]